MRGWLGVALAAATASAARGDVVHLKNGAALQGQVLEHHEGRVVLGMAGGRIEIPGGQVARIEREGRGAAFLAEGRRAVRDGDPAAARRLFQRALDQGEPGAGTELAGLGGPAERATSGEPAARLEEAARALALGEPARARELVLSVRSDPACGPGLRQRSGWLLGRAQAALGSPAAALVAWTASVGRDAPRDPEVLSELARLVWLGFTLRPGTPGLGPGWSVASTPRVLVVARPDLAPALPARVEATLAAVSSRLELRDLGPGKRLTLFVHDDLAAYRRAGASTPWAAGHAARATAPGEVARVVHLTREGAGDSALAHELAHVLLADALAGRGVPSWLHEGVAVHAEAPQVREARYRGADSLPLERILAVTREALPGPDAAPDVVDGFYDRAALLFGVLADSFGPGRAIDLALAAAERGVDLEEVLPLPRGAGSDAAPPPPPRLR